MTPRAAQSITFLSVFALLAGLWIAGRRRAPVEELLADRALAGSGHSEGSQEPCARSLPWRVARVDPRFGIGTATVEGVVERAASLWEAPVGRRIFVRDSVGGFPIRFTYDERQAEGVERRAAERVLRDALDSLETRRRALDTLGPEAVAAREELERLARDHEARRRALQERWGPVEGEAARYTEAVHAVGDRIVAVDREIRVYRFDGPSDLERIVAHELGHALGLGHADVEGAIMGERLDLAGGSSAPPALHPADVELLRARCPGWFGEAGAPEGRAR